MGRIIALIPPGVSIPLRMLTCLLSRAARPTAGCYTEPKSGIVAYEGLHK